MSDTKTLQLPWQGLLALAAVMTGVVWYFVPLNTSRPLERGGVLLKLNRDQDVDARLWQDPLAPAFAHDEQIRAIDSTKDPVTSDREEAIHSATTLCDKIAEVLAVPSNDLLVLPVLVPGGSYAEYVEIRLRTRRAVLEALGTNQFPPRDGEHIGYIRTPSLSAPAAKQPADQDASSSKRYFILPYEWCAPAFSSAEEKAKQVLILWVREEELAEQPLTALASLLRLLNISPHSVKIIGPRSSTTLRVIVDEAAGVVSEATDLDGAVILSPTATVADDLLLRGHENQNVGSVKALLERKVKGLSFHRITTTDSNICRELILELGRRDVHLNLSGPPKGYRGGEDEVALISEWDTFYGRALPLSFARAVSGLDFNSLLQEYPKNIHAVQYLRGIDGMLPGPAGQDAGTVSQKKADEKSRPRETIEGLNQADYLRRLALQLEELHRGLIHSKGAGLRAVGVLGSDVYDKLLVLKALRPSLPGVLFFTNNLDARLGHTDEWDWARNLIVASPFGLSLRPRWTGANGPFDLQGKILPFRDAYQTAVYTATLLASNDGAASLLATRDQQNNALAVKGPENSGAEDQPEWLGLPRLFEIARSGPYELPGSIPGKDEMHDVHPVRDLRWWNPTRVVYASGIALALAGLVVWVLLVVRASHGKRLDTNDGNPVSATAPSKDSVWARLNLFLRKLCRLSSWPVFLLGGLIAWFVIDVLADIQLPNGEPFVWTEGISIWPTETLRLLVVIMAGWFVIKTNASLKENEKTIFDKFGLRFLTPSWWKFAPLFSSKERSRAMNSLGFRGWCDVSGDRIDAKTLWERYISAGEFSVRLARVVPLTLCYLAAGIFLMLLLLLRFPPVPGRGTVSFCVDLLFLLSAIISSVGVTFYIADATMLNRRLIDYLVVKETKWPAEAYKNLRQRWKILAVREGYPPTETVPQKVASETLTAGQTPAPDGVAPDVPPQRLLDDYLDIDLIATRTEVVGELIYYPFVLITLLIISRISLFDNWTWPAGIFIVIVANGGYAAWSAAKLRATAENARQVALKNLNGLLIARTAEGRADEAEARTARETIAMIKAEERGAFAAISRHPLVGALLLPSGGAGIWALTQYLPGFF